MYNRTPTTIPSNDVKAQANVDLLDDDTDERKGKIKAKPNYVGYALLATVVLLTYFLYPNNPINDDSISVHHVFYCGWLTAISTGLGVIPFLFLNEPEKYWLGVSNAVAGGMMIAASCSLAYEGVQFNEVSGAFGYHSGFRVVFGMIVGVVFILIIKNVLDKYEDLKMGDIKGASYKKILLIMLVMTLHSLTEGIGIGVSFGTCITSFPLCKHFLIALMLRWKEWPAAGQDDIPVSGSAQCPGRHSRLCSAHWPEGR